MRFINWDWRPAVLSASLDKAFAVLTPGAAWTSVDAVEVAHSGGLMSEPVWRATFEPAFGPLTLPLDGLSASPAPSTAAA